MMKSEKYQQAKVMIAQLFVTLCVFQRSLQTNCSWLKQAKSLDVDLRAIQHIVFQGVVGGDDDTKIRLYTILEQSKQTVSEFYKGTTKVL